MTDEVKSHYRACNLCEAICGIEIKTQGEEIISIKGDPKDPLGRGHICPKAVALQDIYNDPDRLKQPIKKVDGQWQEISWEEAYDFAVQGMLDVQTRHGKNALALYAGNPNVHNYGSLTHGAMFSKLLKTHNRFSSTSLDQLPLQMMCRLMYGHQLAVPIPDIDNTDYFVIMGGNPVASNGSMMTVPDFKNRIKELHARDGKLVVLDPRKTETAKIADEHYGVKPGTDIYVLLAMINHIFSEGLVRDTHLKTLLSGLDDLPALVSHFTLELAEAQSGLTQDVIQDITQQLVVNDRAALYGRMGISTQVYGSLCNWAIQIINILAGNLDTVGGTLLTHPAFGQADGGGSGSGNHSRWTSRVSNLPEFNGELPATVMSEEMLTPGEGQIKGLFVMAGNPVSASPNGQRLDDALSKLDFIVAVDIYINETTRHADVILPPTSTLEHDHYDIAFLRLGVRNTARFNEAVFEPEDNTQHDWEIFNALAERMSRAQDKPFKPLPAPQEIIEYSLNRGPVTLEMLKQNPHGVDLGPLKPSLPERLGGGNIDCLPDVIRSEIQKLKSVEISTVDDLLLIGRRHVRDCNSWLHNSPRLAKGKDRSQLLMNPEDMEKRQLVDGSQVSVQSKVASLPITVKASEDMMPGVVSLPHGFGHNLRQGVQMSVANTLQGINCNDLTDDSYFDAISGNAALNGVPVSVTPV